MKYTTEQIIPQEYIGTYGESIIDHIHNVLNKNLADAIIENSKQDVVIHFSDFYEQPTEVIPNSICMRRNVTIKPLVRCRDCIHHKPLAILEGEHICEVHNWQSEEDDFCSFAERREDDTQT